MTKNNFLAEPLSVFKYTSSLLQPIELKKEKYTLSLYYFFKRSTSEAHVVKLN